MIRITQLQLGGGSALVNRCFGEALPWRLCWRKWPVCSARRSGVRGEARGRPSALPDRWDRGTLRLLHCHRHVLLRSDRNDQEHLWGEGLSAHKHTAVFSDVDQRSVCQTCREGNPHGDEGCLQTHESRDGSKRSTKRNNKRLKAEKILNQKSFTLFWMQSCCRSQNNLFEIVCSSRWWVSATSA